MGQALRIATWNINSVRAREAHLRRWLERAQPDIVVLQEIKCEAVQFPAGLEDLGYRAEIVGQKAYNGVAALSRLPMQVRRTSLPDAAEADPQARYIEIEAAGLVIGGLYLPNGNSGGEAGYRYKLEWMDRLNRHAADLLEGDAPCVLLGDYNVCPDDADYAPGTLMANDALVRAETRARFRALCWSGFTDALRAVQPHGAAYTFWDYQAGAWQKNKGMRIDHAMMSPQAAERLAGVRRWTDERAEAQPSDHVPLVVELTA